MLSLAGQVSIAGSAIATLHKELSSPSSPRRIIKPVKSPSPSRRSVEVRAPPEPPPPPFRDVRYLSHFEGGAYAVSEEEFEDWEPQVGPPFTSPTLTPRVDFHIFIFTSSANHTPPFISLMKNRPPPLPLPVLTC